MSNSVIVHKGRTTKLPVSLGIDTSADAITSQIRSQPNRDSPLLATWTVTQVTDGSDGEYLFTLDDSAVAAVTVSVGYMDVLRVSDGEPLPVFDGPIQVLFKETVTTVVS